MLSKGLTEYIFLHASSCDMTVMDQKALIWIFNATS